MLLIASDCFCTRLSQSISYTPPHYYAVADSPIPVLHAHATPGPGEPEEAPVELGFAASQAGGGGGDIVERFGPVSPLNLRLQDIDEKVTRDHPERVGRQAW